MATIRAFLSLLAAVLLVTACTPTAPSAGSPATPGSYVEGAADPSLAPVAKSFDTEEELAAFLRAQGTGSDGYAYAGGIAMRDSAVAEAVAPPMADTGAKTASLGTSAGGGSVGTPSYSATNNQVESVDEADIIKTDGNYIYTITGSTLFIVKAYPGEDAQVVSAVDLKQSPSSLFIDGDHLAVFGYFYDLDYFKQLDIRPRNGMTYFTVYDIADKTKPQVVKDYKFEGNYFDARMTGDTVYLALTQGVSADYPLPLIIDGTTTSTVPVKDIIYFPHPYQSVEYATIHAIDLKSPDKKASKTLAVEGSSTLYMSEDNIFLASTTYVNEWEIRQELMMEELKDKLSEKDQALIAKIKATDDDVLSQYEKKSKIVQVYQEYVNFLSYDEQQDVQDSLDEAVQKKLDSYDASQYTTIAKVAVDGLSLSAEGTGTVPGQLANQFSLDEHDGVLRVATTTTPFWNAWARPMLEGDFVSARPENSPAAVAAAATEEDAKFAPDSLPARRTQTTNNVYTLGSDMKVLDKLEDLAPGETIQSTRFMDDRLYMVTFKQVDPFFVIDLSDPKDIKQLGKLKVPGFSRYLHPYSDNVVIGIGRDATTSGRQEGLKISLFDVSDPEKPKELAKWVASDDYSQSTAEYEHKAFLFDKDKELLVIPAYSYDWSKGTGFQSYNGAMVFHITESSIELRGIVDHGASLQYYSPQVERSLWIGDLLYTKSPNLLRINKLSDLSSVKRVTLESTTTGPYPIY